MKTSIPMAFVTPAESRKIFSIPLLFLAYFSPYAASAQPAPPKIDVVASFSILADLARQIGGDRTNVTAIVGPDNDAHVYQPKPSDVVMIGKAKLVILNGLGFESWADRLITSANFRGPRLIASKGVKPLVTRGATDPHAWQDPANVRLYVANIRDALSSVDPGGAAYYRERASAYLGKIDVVERETRAAWAAIDPVRRKVITSHDAFTYYGRAFGVTFLSPQGVNTESEPNAREVAMLIRQIKAEKTKALFLENMSSRQLITRIADETGVKPGGTLYSDALGGNVLTWLDMMRHNTKYLTDALK